MIQRLNGYLAIPHELMHVVAYRMIGKRCAYQFGDLSVKPLEDRTLRERLFCLLFPPFINLLAVVLLAGIWMVTYIVGRYPLDPLIYFEVAPWWHSSMFFGFAFLLTYAGTCTWDVLVAVRLVAEKLCQQPPK